MEFLFKEVTYYYVEGPKSGASRGSRNISVDNFNEDEPERVHIPEEYWFEVLIEYG